MRNHSYENDFDLHENQTACRTWFHLKGFALRLVLKQRHKRTRKWPIANWQINLCSWVPVSKKGFTIHLTLFIIMLTRTSHLVSISCSDFADQILRWHRVQLHPIPGRSTGNLIFHTLVSLESQNFVEVLWKNKYWKISLWPAILTCILKGHCHAIWLLFKNLEGVFASIEFQN